MATIYMNGITNIDFAYVAPDGRILGGSFKLDCEFTGSVEDQEQVIVDFSTLKKRTKALIDDPNIGYDHRLWYIEDWSCDSSIVHYGSEGRTVIDTGKVCTKLDSSALHLIDIPVASSLQAGFIDCQEMMSVISRDIEAFLSNNLFPDHPGLKEIRVNLSTAMTLPPMLGQPKIGEFVHFHYVHGLRNSTSYGCQNIAHGHTSYIYIEMPEDTDADTLAKCYGLALEMRENLDHTIFVDLENIKRIDQEGGYIEFGYTSMSRGEFSMKVYKGTKIHITGTETTIENLVKYVFGVYENRLREIGAVSLAVSEGLDKGSVIKLS